MLFPGVRAVRACSVAVLGLAALAGGCLHENVACNDNTCTNEVAVKLEVPYDYAGLSGKSVEVCRGAVCDQFKFPRDPQDASDTHDCAVYQSGVTCEVQVSAEASEISIRMRIDPPFPNGDLYHVTFRDDATGKVEIDAYRAVKYTYFLLTKGHPECGGCAGAAIDLQPGAPQYADCTSGTCVSN